MDTTLNDLSSLLQSENGCEYTDLSDDPHFDPIVTAKGSINVLHLNIRSLQKNKDNLTLLLSDMRDKGIVVHLIGLCETFVSKESESLFNIENYCAVHRYRQGRLGGGTTVLIHDTVKLLEVLSSDFNNCFESTSVKVEYKSKILHFAEFYHPPNSDDDIFLCSLNRLIIASKNMLSILCSDQNYDILKTETHKGTKNFITEMMDNNFVSYVTKPTRITHRSGTLIDNIYVRSKTLNKNVSYVITDSMSDHYPCLLSYMLSQRRKENPQW